MSITRLEKWCAVVAILMIITSVFWWDVKISLSLFAGAVVSVGSFFLLSLMISQALRRKGTTRAALFGVMVFKLVAVGAVLWFMVTRVPIQVVAFMIGLSAVVISIAIEACYSFCTVGDE